jgi:hypothetical protein
VKLKLERLEHGLVLSVTESIEAAQVAVIKAGLAKAAKSRVLIDLCSLPEALLQSERLASEFLALKAGFACQDREVLVASPVTALGDAPTRELGIALLETAPAREAALLAACLLYAQKLERRKSALEQELSSLESSASSLRRLRKTGSDLRKRVEAAETQIRELAATKRPAASSEENAARLRTAEQTLTLVLQKRGFLEGTAS